MRRTDGPALSPKSVAPHVVFGEATDDQWLPCNMLAASAFGEPLSPAGYLKREKFMSQQTLARDDGVRTWCLFRNDDRGYVLATCKTVRRQLLVTDGGGTYEGNGYCIATVVTHPSHRGQGHASTLLHNVAQWLDGPGQAIASMIYSNKETFYMRSGWSPVTSPAIVLPLQASDNSDVEPKFDARKHIRYLRDRDIDELCHKDVNALVAEIREAPLLGMQTVLTVLPTTQLINWQHAREDFYGTNIHGKSPQHKGVSYCSQAWMYWHHDFRKQCLFIQRIRMTIEQEEKKRDVLAALLLCAVDEARSWNLPKVELWGMQADLQNTTVLLGNKFTGLKPVLKARRRETVSIRWRGGENKSTEMYPNDHYAWN